MPDATSRQSPLELPIFIYYRRSKRVALLNTLAHVGALLCLFLADLGVATTGLIGACLLVHYGVYLKRFFSPEAICFKLDQNDRWQLLRKEQDALDLTLLPGALVHPQIIVMCFREPTGRTRSCVLTHDNLDRRTLRRLRVRLRWPR